MKLTREIIEQGVKEKGYKWFETGDYNINIVGVRNSDTGTEVTNKFDDKITYHLSAMINGSFIAMIVQLTLVSIGWRI